MIYYDKFNIVIFGTSGIAIKEGIIKNKDK